MGTQNVMVATADIVGSCSVAVLVATFGALGVLLAQLEDGANRHLRKWADITEGLGSGVLLSLALLHILVKAQAMLDEQSDFPVANAGLICGFFVMVLSHQLAPKRLLNQYDGASEVTFYFVEASIALHSLMIGLALGFSQQKGWKPLVSLGVALCAHQFLEGYILSTLAKRTLRPREVARVCLVFTLAPPLVFTPCAPLHRSGASASSSRWRCPSASSSPTSPRPRGRAAPSRRTTATDGPRASSTPSPRAR